MSTFKETLRGRIERVQEAIVGARQAGHAYEAELHGARLLDLLDLGARNGVDTTEWVDPTLVDAMTLRD